MLKAIAQLSFFLLVGESIGLASGGAAPGPLCGMALLFCWLQFVEKPSEELGAAAQFLASNLGLLFVPAGVAIAGFGEVLLSNGVAILAAIVISTAVAIALAGLIASAAPLTTKVSKLERVLTRIRRRIA